MLAQARRVRMLILDVDGVLTDASLLYGRDGEELKAFHARDGSALKALAEAGVGIAIISGRTAAAVERRARRSWACAMCISAAPTRPRR